MHRTVERNPNIILSSLCNRYKHRLAQYDTTPVFQQFNTILSKKGIWWDYGVACKTEWWNFCTWSKHRCMRTYTKWAFKLFTWYKQKCVCLLRSPSAWKASMCKECHTFPSFSAPARAPPPHPPPPPANRNRSCIVHTPVAGAGMHVSLVGVYWWPEIAGHDTCFHGYSITIYLHLLYIYSFPDRGITLRGNESKNEKTERKGHLFRTCGRHRRGLGTKRTWP